jgi:hypothetical protein
VNAPLSPLAAYDRVWGDLGTDPDRHASIERCMRRIAEAPDLDAAIVALDGWFGDGPDLRQCVRRARGLMRRSP